jgi:hypothetical protein
MRSTDRTSGASRPSDAQPGPGPRELLAYERYQWGPNRSSWRPGFTQPELPANLTRYLTNGASLSVPSERLGFHFGGMRAPDWGRIHVGDGSASTSASTLISVNLTSMGDEVWDNTTLPSYVPTRANAEMVWLPISTQGVLVAVGGVQYPRSLFPAELTTGQAEANVSPEQHPGGSSITLTIRAQSRVGLDALRTVPLYDVATKQW